MSPKRASLAVFGVLFSVLLAGGCPPASDADGLAGGSYRSPTEETSQALSPAALADAPEVETSQAPPTSEPKPEPEPDPFAIDTDGDGLSDGKEGELGTDAKLQDTDGDGLLDGFEVEAHTDPLKADTDGDSLSDGIEVASGLDPLVPDIFITFKGVICGKYFTTAGAQALVWTTSQSLDEWQVGDQIVLQHTDESMYVAKLVNVTHPDKTWAVRHGFLASVGDITGLSAESAWIEVSGVPWSIIPSRAYDTLGWAVGDPAVIVRHLLDYSDADPYEIWYVLNKRRCEEVALWVGRASAR